MRSIFIETQGLADGRPGDDANHHAQGKQADGNQYSIGIRIHCAQQEICIPCVR